MTQRPVCVALALAEQAILEEGTRNVTLVNCFRRLRLSALPSSGRLTVFAALTNGRGRVVIDLVVSRLDDLDEVHETSRTVRFRSPLQEIWLLFQLSHDIFSAPGLYQVALMAEKEIIAQRVLEVLLTES